jgi:Kef-type K+ transport system membrane component KefB
MIEVDAESFLVITGAALVAAITFAALPSRIVPPVVVLELLLGILIGPQVLGLAQSDEFTEFFGNLGLGMLFFFAGYEIDFARLRGRPLLLAGAGWVLSLALAYGAGGRSRRPEWCCRSCSQDRRSPRTGGAHRGRADLRARHPPRPEAGG